MFAVLVLFATVLLRLGLVLGLVWLIIPRRPKCPHCQEPTSGLVSGRSLRWISLERRWCMECGWEGIGKRTRTDAPARREMPVGPSLAVILVAGWGCAGGAAPPDAVAALFSDSSAWIDLTHSFGPSTIYWPTAKPFTLEKVADGVTPAGFYYAANNFTAAEHGGTHLDSPLHFAVGKDAADQVPVERLVGPAFVVDVTEKAATNPDYLVTVGDIEAAQSRNGPLPAGAIVLVRTGWSAKWSDPAAYLGTNAKGEAAVPFLHFPGIDTAAARLLVTRQVDAVGIDTPSIDYGQSKTYETHQILYGANIPGFENVANLDKLPLTGAYVIALPMKIEGGSGAPLRIVAVVPKPRKSK